MPNSSHLSGVIKNSSQTLTYDNIESDVEDIEIVDHSEQYTLYL